MKYIYIIMLFISIIHSDEMIYAHTLFEDLYPQSNIKNLVNELNKNNSNCIQLGNEIKCDILYETFFKNIKSVEDKFKINTYVVEKQKEATLGIKIEKKDSKFIISHILQNSQAIERLKVNDIILAIDNIELDNSISVFDVINLLNGTNNSVVLLEIQRDDKILQKTVKRKLDNSMSKTINYTINNDKLFINIEDIRKDNIAKYDSYTQIKNILTDNKNIKTLELDLSYMVKNNNDYYSLKNVLSLFLNEHCFYTIVDNNGKKSMCNKEKSMIGNKVQIKINISSKTNYQGLVFTYLMQKYSHNKVEINNNKLLSFDKKINLHNKTNLDKYNFIYPIGFIELY